MDWLSPRWCGAGATFLREELESARKGERKRSLMEVPSRDKRDHRRIFLPGVLGRSDRSCAVTCQQCVLHGPDARFIADDFGCRGICFIEDKPHGRLGHPQEHTGCKETPVEPLPGDRWRCRRGSLQCR